VSVVVVSTAAVALLLCLLAGVDTPGRPVPLRVAYAVLTCPPALAALAVAHAATAIAVAEPLAALVALPLATSFVVRSRTRPPRRADQGQLRVVAANLLFSNDRIEDVAAAITEQAPDVVVLAEVRDAYDRYVAALAPLVPVADSGPERDIVVFTTPGLAASGLATAHLAAGGLTFPVVTVSTPAGPVRVVGVHTTSPRANPVVWRRELRALAADARTGQPTVYAGDFNASLRHAPLLGRLAATEGWWHPTWPSRFPLLELDHVASVGCTPSRSARFRLPGSDHLGVVATVLPAC
jgi:endonuclease/exonuclease/phosphatase (EEP) superfamily protein YafD